MRQKRDEDESTAAVYICKCVVFCASADLPGQLFVHVYRCSAWVGVCWENMLGLASGWKGERGASLRLPHSATSTSIYMRPLHTCLKRHGGSPWTSLHLSSSTPQGLPLHPLWIKAVNHKRSVSEEYKSENSILLNTYVSSLSDWLSFALYSLNYSCLLTFEFFFHEFEEIRPPVGDNLLRFPGIFAFTSSCGFSDWTILLELLPDALVPS